MPVSRRAAVLLNEFLIGCLLASSFPCLADEPPAAPSLTIYNQNFAVVRQEVPLDLKSGTTNVRLTDITMHLEPDSVILRDPVGKRPLQVLEQNYRADPVSKAYQKFFDSEEARTCKKCKNVMPKPNAA